MITNKSLTNIKDIDKRVLQHLFPICEEIKFSDFKSTCMLGRTSHTSYAIWQEWAVERLTLVKPFERRVTEKVNYKDTELQKPTPILERYMDYFCYIEEQRIRAFDNWLADLSSTAIQAFKLNRFEADLGVGDGIHLRAQRSICLVNFVRKYLEPKMLYSLIDNDLGRIRLRFAIKNHIALTLIDAFKDYKTECPFFSDLKDRVQKAKNGDAKATKKMAIILVIIFLLHFVSTFFCSSIFPDEWWCTSGNVANIGNKGNI